MSQVSICRCRTRKEKHDHYPKTLVVFQIRKAPLFNRYSSFNPSCSSEFNSADGHGACHWCHYLWPVNASGSSSQSHLSSICCDWTLLSSLCLAYVYLGNFLSLRANHAVSFVWTLYQDVSLFLPDLSDRGFNGPRDQWYQFSHPIGRRWRDVCSRCDDYSPGHLAHHVFQYFMADDTGSHYSIAIHGDCDESFRSKNTPSF